MTALGQWTTIITDASNDGAGPTPLYEGTLMEYQYDAVNDLVLFRTTIPNLNIYPDAPSADFHFFLPNGLDSGGPTGTHWSTSTQTHKSAFIYADPGGTPPSNFTFTGWPQTVQETNSNTVLCNNCVTISEDLGNSQITFTFNRTDIITNTEMGASTTATIGIVHNIGYNIAWDDAITHVQGGPSNSTFTITVIPQTVLVNSITVQGQGNATIVQAGSTLQMSAIVLPANATNPNVTWSVTNGTGTATINANGLLSGFTDGTVTVVATANDGSGIVGQVTINVQSGPILVNSITVQGQGNATTVPNGSTLQMNAVVLPANATNSSVVWSVTNGTGTATIDANGLLSGITDGTVTVIATANDGSGVVGQATIIVQTTTPTGPILVNSITVQGQNGETTVSAGSSLSMTALMLPLNVNDPSVTWSVTNGTGIGIIDANGVLTGLSAGTIIITATANDGSGIIGQITITIEKYDPFSNTENSDVIIYAPNAFTPNSEVNNTFKVVTQNVAEFKMTLYNRWGEIVFISYDPNAGWNGEYAGNVSVNETYVWAIHYVDLKGVKKEIHGQVLVLE